MEVAGWGFTFEAKPSLVGIGFFVGVGVLGFVLLETRMVLLPIAFLAGVIAGLFTTSRDLIGNNGIVVAVVGYVCVMVLSAAQRVLALAYTMDVTPGDAMFFGIAFFVAEAISVGAILFIFGYAGALTVEKLRTRFEPRESPRDLSRLNR